METADDTQRGDYRHAQEDQGGEEVIEPVVIGDAIIHIGNVLDVLKTMPDESVHCCITSPPYWGLRDYKAGSDMIGLEPTFQEYLEKMV
jgi:hypothetical protein